MENIIWRRVMSLPSAMLIAFGLSQSAMAVQPAPAQWAIAGSDAVLHYELLPHGVVGAEPTPAVTIYADGHVEVSWPEYSPMAGEWQMDIPLSELQQSIGQFASAGLLTMNQQDLIQANEEARSALRADGVIVYNSDSSVSTITLMMTNQAGVVLPAEAHTLRWGGLQATAQQLGSSELSHCASLEEWIVSLAKRAAGSVQ